VTDPVKYATKGTNTLLYGGDQDPY
jgi:hypothetical protein